MADENNTPPEIVEEKIRDLDPRLIKQVENAEKSIDKNPAYVIDICGTVLAKHPSCVEVRKILRQAQFKKFGKGNPISKFVASIQGAIFAMQAGAKLKKGQALEVIAEAEKQLSVCPENEPVLKTLAAAAASLQFWGTAAEAYQSIARFKPDNEKNLLALADALVKSKQPDSAMQVCERILKKNPSNGDAQALARSASVIKTMEKGDWENTEVSATKKVKDAEETLNRQKETSSVNDEETLARMVERLAAQISTDPENINLYREICGHLRTLKRFDEALEYVRKARQQPLGKGDTTFEKMEQNFLVASMDKRIADLQQKIAANPEDAEAKAALVDLKKREHDLKLENAKQMVERYPNDFNYRYELGVLLFEDGNLDEAIMQFQISQRSPKVRGQSLLGLGRAFIAGKKYDMAVDQLETAKKEAKIMNESKKEIVYELATAYELMGKKEQAFTEFKEIYQADISYKDVAAKINAYYASK